MRTEHSNKHGKVSRSWLTFTIIVFLTVTLFKACRFHFRERATAEAVWKSQSKISSSSSSSNGFILVNANGGLNQMRAGICDMVAIARLMNATLVVPELDHSSFWNDPSDFPQIFDEEHFISSLKEDVRIVKDLPASHASVAPLVKAPVSWSDESYYRDMIPLLRRHGVIRFTHADTRLANNHLSDVTQQLRCKASYEALIFTQRIRKAAETIVKRLRSMGPYLALHLRYEKDMLAFTGCSHGLTKEETKALTKMRYETHHWKHKKINSERKRIDGSCPLTPQEVALLLKALGFPRSTSIYLVAGELFGKKSLKSLQEEFPNIQTHNSLASEEELEGLAGYGNRLAGVDYLVAVESDTFVYSYNGNMAKAVEGHRRFAGHRKTISPERKGVVKLVDELRGKLSWERFEEEVKLLHEDRTGGLRFRKPGPSAREEEYFYANPMPGCAS